MLIYIYVQDELSFDAHHAKADRIFRIQSHFNFGDPSDDFGLTQFAMVPTLLQEYPEIESGSWLYVLNNCTFNYQGDRAYVEEDGYYADTAFFRTFDYQWLHGGPHALDEPDNVVITQRMANEMFGSDEPMGKLVERNGRTLKVAGVIDENGPTHMFLPGCFLSLLGMPPQAKEQLMQRLGTSEQLRVPGPAEGHHMRRASNRRWTPSCRSTSCLSGNRMRVQGTMRFNLEPLREVHFNNELIYDTSEEGEQGIRHPLEYRGGPDPGDRLHQLHQHEHR
jgi:hypothetical protein